MNREDKIKNAIKEARGIIRGIFSSIKFSDFPLSDGTFVCSVDSELVTGSEVYKMDDLGNQTPLDNGDYVLADGRTITVENNLVTVIVGPNENEDKSPIEATETPVAASEPSITEVTEEVKEGSADEPIDESNDLDKRVGNLEGQIEEIMNLLKSLSEGTVKANQEMKEEIKKFGAEPGDEPIKIAKTGYQEYSSKKKTTKIQAEELVAMMDLLYKNK